MSEKSTITLDLTTEEQALFLDLLCEHDLKPSELLAKIVNDYISSREEAPGVC